MEFTRTSQAIILLGTSLVALGLSTGAQPAHAAQRVDSEHSWTLPAPPPASWRAGNFPVSLVTRMGYMDLPAERILQVQQRNAQRQHKAVQIGIARNARSESATGLLPTLRWISLKDGSSVARVEIRSPVAPGLRIGLKFKKLDPRAELRFAGSTQPARVVAMMTGAEILGLLDAQGMFWTPGTDGETQILEIRLPAGVARGNVQVQAPQLSHLLTNSVDGFKMIEKIGESGACNVDTACRIAVLGTPFVNAKNAVAHMVFVDSGTSYVCTGTLLADTDGTTQVPYFYSANHCIDNQTVASSLNTYWGYEATSCNSAVQAPTVLLPGGATYLYSNADTDALLLRLNNPPPAGSVLAGWDSNVIPASSNVLGIHHPSGDVKKASTGQQTAREAYLTEVAWVSGTTEQGSSGSALFTLDASSYRLRGGLYGGSASCANTGSIANVGNRDYYSRFDVVFPNISQYLAPAPAAPRRVNGSQPLIPPRPAAVPQAAALPAPMPSPGKLNRRRVPMGPFEP